MSQAEMKVEKERNPRDFEGKHDEMLNNIT